jgi:group I intron endonuclease
MQVSEEVFMGHKIKNPSTIYAIRCIVNGKVYIGRTQNLEQRIRQHWLDLKRGFKGNMRDPSFQNDFDRYGEESFTVHILEEHVPPDAANDREAFWISEYRATNSAYGYNKLNGETESAFKFVAGLPPKIVDPF